MISRTLTLSLSFVVISASEIGTICVSLRPKKDMHYEAVMRSEVFTWDPYMINMEKIKNKSISSFGDAINF